MKVIAFNSSPRMENGTASLILNPFLRGMRDMGAEVMAYDLFGLDIRPCRGDWSCWTKTPGRCFQDDDMAGIYPRLRQADIWMLATPVYSDGMSGALKDLIDRTIPLLHPRFELREGHVRHPRRADTKSGKVVLVSTCGFWEMDNFDALLAHVRAY